jgi:thiamine-phosphate pyrophosphorylase
MRLCAITDRLSLPDPGRLVSLARGWAAGGVDLIQLREKDLSPADLQQLAAQIKADLTGTVTRLLINTPSPESQLAGVADGFHIPGKPQPEAIATVRHRFPRALISVPCHSLQDIHIAAEAGVDLLLFSPIFEKPPAVPQGLEGLQQACAAAGRVPVFALGGITAANAAACVAAGAAGVAGIRLFAGEDWRGLHDI